jgi:hypothetical protein
MMSQDGKQHCESCGMTVESGPYCQYCTDEDGKLQSFDERFLRMVQFMKRRNDDLSQDEAEAQTLAYMATMPAWRNHPNVVGLEK